MSGGCSSSHMSRLSGATRAWAKKWRPLLPGMTAGASSLAATLSQHAFRLRRQAASGAEMYGVCAGAACRAFPMTRCRRLLGASTEGSHRKLQQLEEV